MSRILVVEDDRDLQFLYKKSLSHLGHEIVGVRHTADAILHLTSDEFDLIILDMNMPDMPGLRLIEFVHDDIRLQKIPVLVISANENWRSQVYALGVTQFYVKPVTMQTLVMLVDDALASE
jgi:putative two-component system response regulator